MLPHSAPSVAIFTGSGVTLIGDAEPIEMRQPCRPIGEALVVMFGQQR